MSSLKIDAVDYANFLLGYDQYNVSVVLNYYRRDAKRTMEVICEDGSLGVNLLKNEVVWNGDVVFNAKQTIHDTYKEQMKFFTENILTGNCSANTANEAHQVLKICLAKE